MIRFNFTGDNFFVPSRDTHKTEPAGVRFDPFKIMTKQKKNKLNFNCVRVDVTKTGVRNDNKPHYYTSKQGTDCLHYSKPCLCGSLQHANTTHTRCLLNPTYLD